MSDEKNLVEEKVDDSTLEIDPSTGKVRVKDSGVTEAKLAPLTVSELDAKLSDGDMITTLGDEFRKVTTKLGVVGNDTILIEDSADLEKKKKQQFSSIPRNTLGAPVADMPLTGKKFTGAGKAIANGEFVRYDELGVANGIATLDGSTKVPVAQLPDSIVDGLEPKGTWDASTNTPAISDTTGEKGWFYIVNVAGTQDLGSGNITFAVGDWALHNGSTYEKVLNSHAVSSVFTRQGAVVAVAGDYDASQVDNDSGVAGATVKAALNQLDSDKVEQTNIDSSILTDKNIGDAHHVKYTNDEAVTAMGSKDDANPLNHDKAVPPKAGKKIFTDFAGNPKIATVTFATPFADANYSVGIIGVDARAWSVQSQLAGSFVIDSGSNVAPTGDVGWTATPHSDP